MAATDNASLCCRRTASGAAGFSAVTNLPAAAGRTGFLCMVGAIPVVTSVILAAGMLAFVGVAVAASSGCALIASGYGACFGAVLTR